MNLQQFILFLRGFRRWNCQEVETGKIPERRSQIYLFLFVTYSRFIGRDMQPNHGTVCSTSWLHSRRSKRIMHNQHQSRSEQSYYFQLQILCRTDNRLVIWIPLLIKTRATCFLVLNIDIFHVVPGIIEYSTALYKDLNCVRPGKWNLVQRLFLACLISPTISLRRYVHTILSAVFPVSSLADGRLESVFVMQKGHALSIYKSHSFWK